MKKPSVFILRIIFDASLVEDVATRAASDYTFLLACESARLQNLQGVSGMKYEEEWKKAKKLCRLSNEDIRMARELGMGPRGLIKNIPSPSQRWKAPVAVWIRDLYEKKFGRKAAKLPPLPRIVSNPNPRPKELFEPDIIPAFDDEPPTFDEVAEENEFMSRRQKDFRLAADYVAKAFAEFEAVKKVVLFGSVASPLEKEVPRFRKFRRAGQSLNHECKDVDLAVWLADLSILHSLQRARARALAALLDDYDVGVAHHQVDVFLFAAETDAHLGRLCNFGECPQGEARMPRPPLRVGRIPAAVWRFCDAARRIIPDENHHSL